MGYSNFLGLEMFDVQMQTETFFQNDMLLGNILTTLQLFRSVDLSDIEIQTEELLLLKYTCSERKVRVSSIETQKISIGFETWRFFFFFH